MALRHGDGLDRDRFASYPVDELDVHVAESCLQDHAIATVRPGRQADDEDLFKLRLGLVVYEVWTCGGCDDGVAPTSVGGWTLDTRTGKT